VLRQVGGQALVELGVEHCEVLEVADEEWEVDEWGKEWVIFFGESGQIGWDMGGKVRTGKGDCGSPAWEAVTSFGVCATFRWARPSVCCAPATCER
jgi:hypothetical protein